MTPLSYSDYRKSVERNVTQGLEQLGFTTGQSILFAYNELLLRLEEFPDENVMALTALAIAANQREALSLSFVFYEELVQAYANGEHVTIAEKLDPLQKKEFLNDVDIVSKIFGIC